MANRLVFRGVFRILFLPLLLLGLVFSSSLAAQSDPDVDADPAGFVAESAVPLESDDFNACEVDTELWDAGWVGGGARVETVGAWSGDAQLSIFVPGGDKGEHTITPEDTRAPRVLQSTANTNFTVEAKFTSTLEEAHQIQGILVEGAGDHEFMRFEFHYAGGEIHLYAGILADGKLKSQHNVILPRAPLPGEAYYMRVARSINSWTHSYSYDGVSWFPQAPFLYDTSVVAVGVFGGNSAPGTAEVPYHTALVDYFFNTASPIQDEDGDTNQLTIHVDGNGNVTKDPDRVSYPCEDNEVTLTAVPGQNWSFDSWTGDLTGSDNPATITMNGSRDITAVFTRDVQYLFLPLVVRDQ